MQITTLLSDGSRGGAPRPPLPALQEALGAPGAAHLWWSQPPVSSSTGNDLTAGIVALGVNTSHGGDVPVGHLSLGHTDVFPASPQPHLLVGESSCACCCRVKLCGPVCCEIPVMGLYKEWGVQRILLKSLETHRCQRGQILPTQPTQQDL